MLFDVVLIELGVDSYSIVQRGKGRQLDVYVNFLLLWTEGVDSFLYVF